MYDISATLTQLDIHKVGMIKFYIENFTIKRHTEFTRINAHFLGGIFRYMIRLCKQEEEIFDFFNRKWKKGKTTLFRPDMHKG